MKPFIFGSRNSIHIVDIRETIKGLLRAQKLIAGIVSKGQDVLFVGTKRQAREAVQQNVERCGMHYVTERWLGGMLTNFRTVRSRLKRLEELEALQQSPQWDTGYSKKMQSTLSRELRKIRRNLDGVRRMSRLPAVLVAIDVRKETNALREARKLGIPTVCLIDTDSDPDMVSIAIPGNDDAMRAINVIMSKLADAVELGIKGRPEPKPDAATGDGTQPRRRVRRSAPSDRGATAQPAAPVQPVSAAPAPAPAQPQPAPTQPVAATVGASEQPSTTPAETPPAAS